MCISQSQLIRPVAPLIIQHGLITLTQEHYEDMGFWTIDYLFVTMEEKYILSLDIGTTTIRSYIYNSRAEVVGKAVDQVHLLFYLL